MKKIYIISLFIITAAIICCGDNNNWLKGTWETSNRTLGLMINPDNNMGGVRTVLLEDKWIPGNIKFQGNTLLFTYLKTEVQLTFRIDKNSKRIFSAEGSELKKVSSDFDQSNHFN